MSKKREPSNADLLDEIKRLREEVQRLGEREIHHHHYPQPLYVPPWPWHQYTFTWTPAATGTLVYGSGASISDVSTSTGWSGNVSSTPTDPNTTTWISATPYTATTSLPVIIE